MFIHYLLTKSEHSSWVLNNLSCMPVSRYIHSAVTLIKWPLVSDTWYLPDFGIPWKCNMELTCQFLQHRIINIESVPNVPLSDLGVRYLDRFRMRHLSHGLDGWWAPRITISMAHNCQTYDQSGICQNRPSQNPTFNPVAAAITPLRPMVLSPKFHLVLLWKESHPLMVVWLVWQVGSSY